MCGNRKNTLAPHLCHVICSRRTQDSPLVRKIRNLYARFLSYTQDQIQYATVEDHSPLSTQTAAAKNLQLRRKIRGLHARFEACTQDSKHTRKIGPCVQEPEQTHDLPPRKTRLTLSDFDVTRVLPAEKHTYYASPLNRLRSLRARFWAYTQDLRLARKIYPLHASLNTDVCNPMPTAAKCWNPHSTRKNRSLHARFDTCTQDSKLTEENLMFLEEVVRSISLSSGRAMQCLHVRSQCCSRDRNRKQQLKKI
jgi:hypothetical protein